MNTATDSAADAHNQNQPGPSEADAALERRIECARVAMTLATDERSQRDHLERMTLLIAQRASMVAP